MRTTTIEMLQAIGAVFVSCAKGSKTYVDAARMLADRGLAGREGAIRAALGARQPYYVDAEGRFHQGKLPLDAINPADYTYHDKNGMAVLLCAPNHVARTLLEAAEKAAAADRALSGATLSCPQCSGIAEGHRDPLVWPFVVLLFPIGLLLLLVKQTYTCKSCGFKFKA